MRVVALLTVALSVALPAARAEPFTVSAAISTREAMEQIGRDYGARTGDVPRFNFDASGRLEQQIKQGAPVDAFLSAGDQEVNELTRAGKADPASRQVVVDNALVLIVPAGATGGPESLADLAADPGKVAAGDPRSVPAGHYAQQTLAAMKLTAAVAPRLVLGQNVRQVLTYVTRGEVSAGLVYATDAKQAGDKVRVVATADPSTHDPIEYPAVAVTGSAHAAPAGRFLAYLQTPSARAVFVAHGFTLPPTRGSPAK